MGSTGIKDNSNFKHVWAGILIVIITGVILTALGVSSWWTVPISLVAGIGAGFAKEYVWDSYMGKGHFSWADIWATTWGSFVGVVILIFILNFVF